MKIVINRAPGREFTRQLPPLATLSSKYTKSHLTTDAYSTPAASPRLILADVVSNNAMLNCSDYSDNASSAFLLIMILFSLFILNDQAANVPIDVYHGAIGAALKLLSGSKRHAYRAAAQSVRFSSFLRSTPARHRTASCIRCSGPAQFFYVAD
ncbi:MAG: hypothetical protein R6W74_01230 [Nitrosomonas halophila]